MLLGIAEDKLDLETGAVEIEEACRCQLRVGPAGQDMDHLQPVLPSLAVQRGMVQGDLFLLQGRAGHGPRVAAVEATIARPLAPRSPFVGPGVAEAQDCVLALPSRYVQAQGPHPSTKVLVLYPPSAATQRTPSISRAPAAWSPGIAGRRGGRCRPSRHPRRPAGRPPGPGARRGPCCSRTSPGPRSGPRSWVRSWRPGPAVPRPVAPAGSPGRSRVGARRRRPARTSAHGCAPTAAAALEVGEVVRLRFAAGHNASILRNNRTGNPCRWRVCVVASTIAGPVRFPLGAGMPPPRFTLPSCRHHRPARK